MDQAWQTLAWNQRLWGRDTESGRAACWSHRWALSPANTAGAAAATRQSRGLSPRFGGQLPRLLLKSRQLPSLKEHGFMCTAQAGSARKKPRWAVMSQARAGLGAVAGGHHLESAVSVQGRLQRGLPRPQALPTPCVAGSWPRGPAPTQTHWHRGLESRPGESVLGLCTLLRAGVDGRVRPRALGPGRARDPRRDLRPET